MLDNCIASLSPFYTHCEWERWEMMFGFKDVYSIYFIFARYDSFYIIHMLYSAKSIDC